MWSYPWRRGPIPLILLIALGGCATTPQAPAPKTIALAPGETIIKIATLEAMKAQIAEMEKPVATTASCRSATAAATSLAQQLAEARAGDPVYQKLETRINDLQNRLAQSQQRESDLRKKLNELVQIEKNAGLPTKR